MTNSTNSFRTLSRSLTIGTAAVACALSLGACSSSGNAATTPSSNPTSSTPGTATPVGSGKTLTAPHTTAPITGTPAPGEPGSPEQGEGGASGTGASATGYCAESQLKATLDPRHVPGNGTKDSQGRTLKGVYVDFQNTSGSSCVLYGYPGAATEDATNHQLQQGRRTLRGPLGGLPGSQKAAARVTLAPGKYAAALIEGVDEQEKGAAQAGCASTTPRILVTPPNTRTPVPFTLTWGVCYSFDVHPVQPLPTAP